MGFFVFFVILGSYYFIFFKVGKEFLALLTINTNRDLEETLLFKNEQFLRKKKKKAQLNLVKLQSIIYRR